MLSEKVKKHLMTRVSGKRGLKMESKILAWLDDIQKCGAVWRANDVRAAIPMGSGTLYSAIYRLAAQGKIGFASTKYHVFKHSEHETIKATSTKRAGVLLWHKDYEASAPLREEWIDEPSEQLPLFDGGLESMSSEDLKELIQRAERIQIQRGIDRRYACLSGGVREQLADVFASIKITDPVYYAHSDKSLSFLTYTAVPSMPIDVVIDSGDGPKRLNCKHLTIFGKAIVNATDSMFGGE